MAGPYLVQGSFDPRQLNGQRMRAAKVHQQDLSPPLAAREGLGDALRALRALLGDGEGGLEGGDVQCALERAQAAGAQLRPTRLREVFMEATS